MEIGYPTIGGSIGARRPAPDFGPVPALFWAALFGNHHPVTVEIGPGRGEFLFHIARSNPHRNFFAIERSPSRAMALLAKLKLFPLANARLLQGDARCVVGLLPDTCVQSFYVHFPDPWWKRRHRPRRLWSADVVASLRRTLIAGGTIEFSTDVREYFEAAQRSLDADTGLETVRSGPIPEGPSTAFAQKAALRRAVIYGSVHRRRA